MEIQPIKNVCNLMLYTNLVRQQPINGVDIRKSRGQVIEVFFEIFYVICQVRFIYFLPKLYYVEKAVRRGCFKDLFLASRKLSTSSSLLFTRFLNQIGIVRSKDLNSIKINTLQNTG